MANWQFKQYDLDSYHIDIVGYIPSKTNNSEEDQKHQKEKKPSFWSELSQEQKDYYNLQRAGYRAKSKVRRSIIKHNMRYMWTLTFSQKFIKDGRGKLKDTGNFNDAWSIWRAFLKRCKRKGLDFPYIVVIEVQEERRAKHGEKVYHFHFCTNKFIHHSKKSIKNFNKNKKASEKVDINTTLNMEDLWGHGYVYATSFKNDTKQAAAGYLTKYVTKSFEEIEGKGLQRYRISEGLEVEGRLLVDFHKEYEIDEYVYKLALEKKCIYKKSYHLIDGENEILIYTIFPKLKKKNNRLDHKSSKPKKWKSLEKSVPINLSKGDKKPCQSTTKRLQLNLF